MWVCEVDDEVEPIALLYQPCELLLRDAYTAMLCSWFGFECIHDRCETVN